ncbi:MAG: hypothetical protein HLUCCA12_04420 [Rhodobacteraceae bacterium HLUCCA12]|nr:MAG: hypothetical protein HLUCCA12_04420 [Rhodobacteraceae bacterium HLUCCA12]
MRAASVLVATLFMLGALTAWLGAGGPGRLSVSDGAQGMLVEPAPARQPATERRASGDEGREARAALPGSGDSGTDETGTDNADPAPQEASAGAETGTTSDARAEDGSEVPMPPAVGPQPLDRRVILSGHSLTDPMDRALPQLVRAAGGPAGTIALSTIPGAPMDWRWNNRTHPPDARTDIGDFDVMVQTERVALSGTRPWHNSDEEALRWARHGWENGADGQGAEVLLYATWVSLDTGPGHDTHGDPDRDLPWRERLDREFAGWEAIMAQVNANRPEGAPPMRMIPATLVMAEVHDAIEAGEAPAGLSDIRQLFTDDIHLSPMGAWLVALTHYAVIYARDPRGLPGPDRQAAPELVDWAQDLVWRVVTGYRGTGVRGS